MTSTWGDTVKPVLKYPEYAILTPAYHITSEFGGPYDFSVTYEDGHNDLTSRLIPTVHRPGFSSYISLIVDNVGTTELASTCYIVRPAGVNLEVLDLPSTVVGDTTFVDLNRINPRESFMVKFRADVSPSVQLGEELCYQSGVYSAEIDVDSTNNFSNVCEVVVGSYDPNDKKVDPVQLDPDEIDISTRLSYTVRFQNTGTYYAENVEIRDQLSSKLDISTIRIDAASHEPYTYTIDDGHNLVVKFDGIVLPDSTTNESESHGFVHFSIAPQPGLQLGDFIENTASIYFDFNDPIITNTVSTIVEYPKFDTESNTIEQLILYPNPASDIVQLELPKKLTMVARVDLLDSSGKQLESFQASFINGLSSKSISNLPVGFHQLVVKHDGVRYIGKLTVVR